MSQYGGTLETSLDELDAKLVAFLRINRQRDSLELLADFMGAPKTHVHVVRNGYFGDEGKFELYNGSDVRKSVEARGGLSATLPDVADRVAGDIYSQRLMLSQAAKALPSATGQSSGGGERSAQDARPGTLMTVEDSFAKLVGRQASEAEHSRLYRLRDALGLRDNDAFWSIVMALEHVRLVLWGVPRQARRDERAVPTLPFLLNELACGAHVRRHGRHSLGEVRCGVTISESRGGKREARVNTGRAAGTAIVGYIREFAVGSPLMASSERVDRALQRIRKTHRAPTRRPNGSSASPNR